MWTEHLNSSAIGKVLCASPRSEPDSGNPTIRDRRGAWGNVAMAELGTHSATERAGLETLCLTSARPSSIPTLQERRTANPSWPRVLRAASRGGARSVDRGIGGPGD